VLPLLKRIGAEIDKLNAVDPRSRELREGLELVRSAAMDFEAAVSERATGISLNEEELETLEQRLTELARLQRKYRVDDRGLVELLEAYRGELRSIEDIEQLELRAKKVNELEKNVSALAEALAEKRRSVGESLSKLVEPELKELNMPHARLAVQATRGQLSIQGMDTLELMISSNKGEALKPLKQVASGGELSRVLLVLKKVLQERSGVHVLIFDEIDAGVSGGVARAVGEKLKALSEHSQVLCITHLPQIASLADNHLLVEKKIGGKRTVSVVKELVGDEKVDEIARMLAGYKVTSASRESARELLSSKKR
jgi:DNA repair protein RecN (Recombination protein N)